MNIDLVLNKTEVRYLQKLLYWQAHKMQKKQAAELFAKLEEVLNDKG